MRTIQQIERKAKALIAAYREEARTKGYSENMGEKYMRQLDKHVGNFYDYDWDNRRQILSITEDLERVVTNP